ncbi:unnamed protein product [Brachionus calyciflorus]|uniref:Transposase domain-containing protein n=1 Tax=Brachionus calyciflorus TaxID=104777 RepID=A0A814D1S5_9BILA|nr:unnamed protein product [Brachionus calyciflorus]
MQNYESETSNESDQLEFEDESTKFKFSNLQKQKRYRDKRKLELKNLYEISKKKTKHLANEEPSTEVPVLTFDFNEKNTFETQNDRENNCIYNEPNLIFDTESNTSLSSIESINEPEDIDKGDEDSPIYFNSNFKRTEFVTLFESLVDKLAIPETRRDILYKFIQLILPQDSNIPKSYNLLKKSILVSKVETTILCGLCQNKIITLEKNNKMVKKCENEFCSAHKKTEKTIKLCNTDFVNQIKIILDNNYDQMVTYKNKLEHDLNLECDDIMSGSLYRFETNTINLVLFADGVSYNKSGINSMWVILSQIVELPPILRSSFENILFHSSWTGSQPDFNFWLEKYNKQIDDVLINGFRWNGINFKLNILAFIADSPARSKACNSVQFNGYYGCLKCLHPGVNLNQIRYPNLSKIRLRTKNIYENQVRHFIDKRLLSVRLPNEIKRKCRSIEERNFYKANEYRTIALYISFALFKGILDDKYLNNLMKYVIFLRLLCQNKISEEDLSDSHRLIVDFVVEYEKLYGKEQMTFNVHAHLHLPLQVKCFGPLNKCSSFSFENVFKITRDLFHGTRNFEGQIANNFERRKEIRREARSLLNTTSNPELRNYLNNSILNCYRVSDETKLINPHQVNVRYLKPSERNLCNEFINQKTLNFEDDLILKSERATINYVEYHTFSYDKRFESQNCSIIKYLQNDGQLKFGIIINFYEISNTKLGLIKKFKQKEKDSFFDLLNYECSKHIDRFFQIGEITDELCLIDLKSILGKCVLIEFGDEFMISTIDYLTEDD